ncbi:hypothetical protein [Oricola sp.]|uniref:cell division protein FtsL n=1 Tax=Oricola sp. TaxID=1979950 RepID=UPI0025D60704|nr:hypothetical protein [Oricola sp.]MCI5074253.1 hypothetical protein [Oricola sp.]
MMRIVNIVLIVLMLGAATWTYAVKYTAERRVAEIAELERRIGLEKETINLLEADWSYLSQPARLKTLSDLYGEELQLQQTEPRQIVHPQELPAAPELPMSDGVADIIAGSAPDPMTTGSVGGN